MSIETIYLDRRTFVSGSQAYLKLDNAFNLQDYIVSIAGTSTGTGITTVENGLYSPSTGVARQGGPLIENTTINGQFEYSLGRDTEGTYIKSGSMLGTFAGQTGVFFQRGDAAVNTTYATMGVASDNDIHLYRDNQVTENVRSLRLDDTQVLLTSRYGTNDFVTSDWSNGTITNTINYQVAAAAATQYTQLTTGGLVIGHTGGLPTLPVTTDFYRMPDRDGLAGYVITTDGTGQTSWQLPTVAGATNGLNVDGTTNFVKMGGNLIENTVIGTAGFEWSVQNAGATNYLFVDDTQVDMQSTNARIRLSVSNIFVNTPGYYDGVTFGAANSYGTAGRLLQNTNATTGTVEFTPYVFPLADGTANQLLFTDGAANLSFGSANSILQAANGLTLNTTTTPHTVELGGTLNRNTAIVGANFNFGGTGLGAFDWSGDSSIINFTNNLNLISEGSVNLATGATGRITITTPNRLAVAVNNGALLQLIDNTDGRVEYTPYVLPTADGTAGQVLITDGAGNITFSDNLNNVITLTGVAAGSTNLGAFTGTTITDNTTIKNALQELEIAVENSLGGADNGLTEVVQAGTNLVRLGGNLIQNTTVNTTAGFTFQVNDGTNAAVTVNGATQLASIGATNVSVEVDPSRVAIKTNTYTSAINGTAAGTYGTAGKILQNTNATTGEMEVTPYAMPLTDGTANQILKTDGAGQVSWVTRPYHIGLQEFLSNELLLDRTGESFFVVPSYMNGFTLTAFDWAVFTPNTGTFSFEVQLNGVAVAGSATAVVAGAQTGNIAGLTQALATGDRINIVTSANAGAAPAGFGITMRIDE